jgi:outer membrane lipoprotein SlyB
MKTALRVAVVISAISLSGCASMDEKRMQLQGESTAARPESVRPSTGIEKTLRCIRETGRLRKVIFAIGPWVDSTGKSNASAVGAFLPQAGTATFVTDTIRRTGGKALVKYFGAAQHQGRLHHQRHLQQPRFRRGRARRYPGDGSRP